MPGVLPCLSALHLEWLGDGAAAIFVLLICILPPDWLVGVAELKWAVFCKTETRTDRTCGGSAPDARACESPLLLTAWTVSVVSSYTYSASGLPDIDNEAFIKDCVHFHNKLRSEVKPAASDMLYMTPEEGLPFYEKRVKAKGVFSVGFQLYVQRQFAPWQAPPRSYTRVTSVKTWDPVLARIAKAWARKCQFSHNVQLKTPHLLHPNFTSLGENIWSGTQSIFSVSSAITSWYNEVEYYDFKTGNAARSVAITLRLFGQIVTKLAVQYNSVLQLPAYSFPMLHILYATTDQRRLGPPPPPLPSWKPASSADTRTPQRSCGPTAARLLPREPRRPPTRAASKPPKCRLAAPEARLCCSTAMVQTLSSRRRWQRELSVLPAQSPPSHPKSRPLCLPLAQSGNYPTWPYKKGSTCSACPQNDNCLDNLCASPQRDKLTRASAGSFPSEVAIFESLPVLPEVERFLNPSG
ncbi:hypothetical protein QTO34_017299 [Cnephaeus nilssonii]|uniref:SCP domain-containing protein n=1 Tax=Cnephaeus nilssonii TaxID=3371016 RepID=A0AA40I1P3_CNENI|nr:hypothetical protein QTO34_017299 [Eptesicus nilssonii]